MRPANPNEQLVDFALLAGVLGLLLFQMTMRAEPPAAPAGPARPSIAAIRAVEERGLVIDGSAEFSADVNAAIDPEGRATSPKRMLDDARDALIRTPGALPEQHLVWVAVAAALGEDRIALEALGELARTPDNLARFGPQMDELNRLSRGQPALDAKAVTVFFETLGATPWLGERLNARHLANSGLAAESEAAVGRARAVASSFVSKQLLVIGLQFGLMLVGLVTLVVFPLMLRRRLLAAGRGGLDLTTSPFRLDRTRRVLVGWLLFTWIAQLAIGMLRAELGPTPGGIAGIQTIATLVNAAIAIILIRAWGTPEYTGTPPAPGLLQTLRLRFSAAGTRVRTVLLWAIPAIGVAVVSIQLSVVVSALIFGPPDSYQESVQFLMSGASDLDFLLVGIGAVLVAPLAEEILFRGFIYRNLRDSMGRPAAIILSGLIFGAVHLHPQFILPLAGLGAGLAILYEWSGSLWVPIIAHAAWNALTLYQVHASFHF